MSMQEIQTLKARIWLECRELTRLRHNPLKNRGDVLFYFTTTLEHLNFRVGQLREASGMVKRESKQVDWQGFADVRLSTEEKELYRAWDVHDDDLWLLVVDAIGAGHKLSLTFNKQNDQFVASFTGQSGTGKNEGFTLSAYAKDFYGAIRVLAFKHTVLLEGSWEKSKDRTSDDIG